MADVQFNEEPELTRIKAAPRTSWSTKLVVSLGLAKSEKGAQLVLVIFVGLCVIAMIALFYVQSNTATVETQSQIQNIVQLQNGLPATQ